MKDGKQTDIPPCDGWGARHDPAASFQRSFLLGRFDRIRPIGPIDRMR